MYTSSTWVQAVRADGSPLYPCERTVELEAEEREAKRRQADGTTALPERTAAKVAATQKTFSELRHPVQKSKRMNHPECSSTVHPNGFTKKSGEPLIVLNDKVSPTHSHPTPVYTRATPT